MTEDAVSQWLRAARARWPEVSLDQETYHRYLAERESPGVELAGADLYLACACARGDPAAIRAFERDFFPDLLAALKHMRVKQDLAEDIVQSILGQLFVAGPERPPLIVDYGGRSGLRTWLRSIAVHAALKAFRNERRNLPLDDRVLQRIVSPQEEPWLAQLKQGYAREFKAAFDDAMRSLEPRQRNLLRQNVIDGLSIDEIGSLYDVHRATAARWLAKIRLALLEETRRGLMKRLRVDEGELDSMMRLARSQLHVSIHRVLEG